MTFVARRLSPYRIFLILAALPWFFDCGRQTRLQPASPPDQWVALSPGQTHRYALNAKPGNYLRLVVIQRNVDLALAFDGGWADQDNDTGYWGREVAEGLVPSGGMDWFEVRHLAGDGRYRLVIEANRVSGQEERDRLAGLAIFEELAGFDQWDSEGQKAFRHRLDQAGVFLEQAPLAEARGWYQLGKTIKHRPTRMGLLSRAALRFHGGGHDGWATLAYQQAAIAQRQASDFHDARHSLQDSLQLAESMGNGDGIAKSHDLLGHQNYETGNWFQAKYHYRRAQRGFEDLGRRKRAWIALRYQAVCEYMMGRYDHARDLMLPLLSVWPPEETEHANLLLHLAWIDHLEGNHAAAIDRLKPLTKRNLPPPGVWDRLGSVQRESGDFEAARASYQIALEKAATQMGREIVIVNLAHTALLEGNWRTCLDLLGRVSANLGNPERLENSNHAFHLSAGAQMLRFRETGAPAALVEAEKATLQLLDGLQRQRQLNTHLAADRSFTDLHAYLMDTVVAVYALCHRHQPHAGYHQRALAAVSSMRARGLRELLQVEPDVVAGDQSWFQRKQALSTAISSEEAHLRENGRPGSLKLRQLLDQRAELRAELLRGRRQWYKDLSGTLDLAGLQRSLEREQVLVYYLGEEEGYLWQLSAQGLKMHILPGRKTLEPEIRRFRALLESRDPSDRNQRERISLKLGDLLLGPALPMAAGISVVLVKDGALHDISFAALQPGGRSWRQMMLSNQPSTALFQWFRGGVVQEPRAQEPMVIFADPVYSNRDPIAVAGGRGGRRLLEERLPYTGIEADMLKDLVPEAVVYRRYQANLANASRLGPYRMVHMAAHGFFDPTEPELSGIQLSTLDPMGNSIEGVLRTHEWVPGSLRAELVTLSACDTAKQATYRAEGAWGQASALMGAGARRVLVNLWRVDDAAGALFMGAFYRSLLKEGQPPAKALAAARGEVARQYPEPYYWAGFVLMGEPGGILTP